VRLVAGESAGKVTWTANWSSCVAFKAPAGRSGDLRVPTRLRPLRALSDMLCVWSVLPNPVLSSTISCCWIACRVDTG
jgi:hypothetical protein